MDVRLHLAERDTQSIGNVLIAEILKVKQHQRHALVIRQTPKRPFELFVPLRPLQVVDDRG